MKRNATATWQGTLKEGKGALSSQTDVLKDTLYSFFSRFENGSGTNPEELVAAAHAGCFAMQVSANLSSADFQPQTIDVKCEINLVNGAITESHLILNASVPGVPKEKFDELVDDAKSNCIISKLLNTKITLDSTLNS